MLAAAKLRLLFLYWCVSTARNKTTENSQQNYNKVPFENCSKSQSLISITLQPPSKSNLFHIFQNFLSYFHKQVLRNMFKIFCLNLCLTSYTKTDSKLTEEKKMGKASWYWIWGEFLGYDPNTQTKIDIWDSIKL